MQEYHIEYAGFWMRVTAFFIDMILIAIVTWPILAATYGWDYFNIDRDTTINGTVDFFVSWILPSMVIIAFWFYKSATPGKIALSLKIIDVHTLKRPTKGQFVIRYFSSILSALPLGLGLIWVAFDDKKQAWHDKLAGTLVVRGGTAETEGNDS